MERAERLQVDSKSLLGYSNIARLGHSQERVDELSTQLARVLTDVATLWQVDVRGTEMAITFGVEDTAGL